MRYILQNHPASRTTQTRQTTLNASVVGNRMKRLDALFGRLDKSCLTGHNGLSLEVDSSTGLLCLSTFLRILLHPPQEY